MSPHTMNDLVVHRYDMPRPGGTVVHDISIHARFIHFGAKSDRTFHAWYLLDVSGDDASRLPTSQSHLISFTVIATGQHFPADHFYLGTHIDLRSDTVWHLIAKDLSL